jgi:hypothetical protein
MQWSEGVAMTAIPLARDVARAECDIANHGHDDLSRPHMSAADTGLRRLLAVPSGIGRKGKPASSLLPTSHLEWLAHRHPSQRVAQSTEFLSQSGGHTSRKRFLSQSFAFFT